MSFNLPYAPFYEILKVEERLLRLYQEAWHVTLTLSPME